VTQLDRIGWQHVVYAARPSRRSVLSLTTPWSLVPLRVDCYRNQGFESIAPLAAQFARYAGLVVSFHTSDYDDSLAWTSVTPADCHLIWLDYDRYSSSLSPPQLGEWLAGRIAALRGLTTAPIIVNDWNGELGRAVREAVRGIAGCHVLELGEDGAGPELDERLLGVAGSRLSGVTQMAAARQLGLGHLPAVAGRLIKGIVVDLDGTLIDGVLAEDGVAGVKVTDQHRAFHRSLTRAHAAGLLLALVSRNVQEDVEALFRERTDLEISLADFDVARIGWTAKADVVADIAAGWHIHPDSLLFIDDNAGELAQIASRHPGTALVHASAPELCALAIRFEPGMTRLSTTADDSLRSADLKAAAERQRLQDGLSHAEYLADLNVRIGVRRDDPADIARLYQLSIKTNQFNTSLRRLTEADVEQYVARPDRAAVAVTVSDRLTASGIVGAVFAAWHSDVLTVDEVDISCRALGRGIESAIVTAALDSVIGDREGVEVQIPVTHGPRNGPALDWHRSYLEVASGSTPAVDWAELRDRQPTLPLSIEGE
jgi:FkbH-like protein